MTDGTVSKGKLDKLPTACSSVPLNVKYDDDDNLDCFIEQLKALDAQELLGQCIVTMFLPVEGELLKSLLGRSSACTERSCLSHRTRRP